MDAEIRQLIADLGPIVEANEIVEYANDTWVVSFEEGLEVGIEHDPVRGMLVFSADLGVPPSGTESVAHKLLLQVALSWRETGGMRMGLDPLDDSAIQIRELPLDGLTLESFSTSLQDFAQFARNARQVIATLVLEERLPSHLNFIRG